MDIIYGILFLFNALLLILCGLDVMDIKTAFPLLCMQNIIVIAICAVLNKE